MKKEKSESDKEKIRVRNKKYTERLPDAYIRGLLRRRWMGMGGLTDIQITPKLIEMKREHLQRCRAIREGRKFIDEYKKNPKK